MIRSRASACRIRSWESWQVGFDGGFIHGDDLKVLLNRARPKVPLPLRWRLAGDLHRGGRALPPWRQPAALPRHRRIGGLTSGVANLRYEPQVWRAWTDEAGGATLSSPVLGSSP